MRSVKKDPRIMVAVAAVLLFAAAVIWFLAAVGNTQTAASKEQRDGVQRMIENAVTMCYSIEGAYPEYLTYLTEEYGVHYDSSRYIVHYSCFAANIRPSVTVIERGG